MNRRAFTLIELLVVIAIIAILAAFLFPVFVAARNATYQVSTSRSAKDVMTAMSLYLADSDDTYPLAMYAQADGLMTWFGKGNLTGDNKFDPMRGILGNYVKGKLAADRTLMAQPYLGDETGIGYNYGVIGGNFHITGDYSGFPNCTGAARGTELSDPSETVVLATSAFYNAKWLTHGDGQKYYFNFIDPPSAWHGNPNVDFRHFGKLIVDDKAKKVSPTGRAIIAHADTSIRNYEVGQMKEEWFWRLRQN